MLNLLSYDPVVGLYPSMPESSMRRLIYLCQLGRRRLRSATPRNLHMQRTQSCPIFPRKQYEPLAAAVGDMAKLPRTFHKHVVYAATVRLAARILTQSRINSNHGTLPIFHPILASSSSSSSRAPPRALRENLEKTLASLSLCNSRFPPNPPWPAAVLTRRWRRRAKPRRSRRAP